MGRIFFSIPLFLFLSVFQSVVVSRIRILSGTADIVILAIISWAIIDEESNHLVWAIIGGFFISILSALPISSTFLIYISAALIAKLIGRILWQSPLLALLASTGIATIIKFFIELFTIQLMDIPAPFGLSVGAILLPAFILNIFFAFPIYVLMADISNWISPKDEKYA